MFKKSISLFLCPMLLLFMACGSDSTEGGDVPPQETVINITQTQISAPASGGSYGDIVVSTTGSSLRVQSNNPDWLTVSMASQSVRVGVLTITVATNTGDARYGSVSVISDNKTEVIEVSQEKSPAPPVEEDDPEEMTAPSAYVPDGYQLVWNDEFNTGTLPSSGWSYEQGRGDNGWGNREEQYYIVPQNGSNVGFCKNGYMNIVARKNGSRIESIRMNTNQGWTYGYFEARIKLPKGKGTWPAFWMLPYNNDWAANPWPGCGEIDIMEEVGVDPNVIVCTLHADGHNHSNNTQGAWSRSLRVPTAESEYHIYALEWTADRIRTYVDGQLVLDKENPGTGKSDWPYDVPFNLKLNLAWGGNWGGMSGTDESALPCTLKIDYVRVYQK
ncbi:MAG: family 16 glycosylhydrolase [Prevotella sp.]|nr:family 16 glycosylhydrolase [Prevotella sp.]